MVSLNSMSRFYQSSAGIIFLIKCSKNLTSAKNLEFDLKALSFAKHWLKQISLNEHWKARLD